MTSTVAAGGVSEGVQVADEVYSVLEDYTFDILDEIEKRLIEARGGSAADDVRQCVDQLADVLQVAWKPRFDAFDGKVIPLISPPSPLPQKVEMEPLAQIPSTPAADAAGSLEAQRDEYERLAKEIAEAAEARALLTGRVVAKERMLVSARATLERIGRIRQAAIAAGIHPIDETLEQIVRHTQALLAAIQSVRT
jgi:hypothetical protein